MNPASVKKFGALFRDLKKILAPYARHLTVASNTATLYTLTGVSGGNRAKRFGGVAIRRDGVTFYSCPELLQEGSPRLKASMSGTASVSFTRRDESLVQELAALTAKRFRGYRDSGIF